MAPPYQLRIAHALMALGIAPWMLDIGWIATILFSTRGGQAPRVLMLDPIAMIGVMITTFAIGVTVAGLSTLWSIFLTVNNPELRSQAITRMRIAVAVVLIVPPVLLIGITALG